jgi:hypothetical protein
VILGNMLRVCYVQYAKAYSHMPPHICDLFFGMHKASSKWSPKRRVTYIHVGEPSELGSL